MSKSIFILLLSMFTIIDNWEVNKITKDDFKLITYKTEDDGHIEAALFEGKKDLAVIFAHGAIFNKESWYFMAEQLQSKSVSSLSIDFRGYGHSKKGSTDKKAFDILGAITYLKEQGYKKIAIVGGSMGGKAILDAIEINKNIEIIKVVLLSPAAGGIGISSNSIKKLFVVSENESLFPVVNKIFNESSNPKQLKVFKGNFHAQHMFKGPYSNELSNLIIDFLTN